MSIETTVTLKGPFFTKNLTDVVKDRFIEEALNPIEKRLQRGGKGLGEQRNVTTTRRQELELTETFTLRKPRVSGRTKLGKQIGQVRAIAPRAMRKTAQRIAEELS